MSFSSHEMILLLRARDEASRVLRRVSASIRAANRVAHDNQSVLLTDYANQRAAIIDNARHVRTNSAVRLAMLERERRATAINAKKTVESRRAEIDALAQRKKDIVSGAAAAAAASRTEINGIKNTIAGHRNSMKIQQAKLKLNSNIRLALKTQYQEQRAHIMDLTGIEADSKRKQLKGIRDTYNATIRGLDKEKIGINNAIAKRTEYIRKLDVKKQSIIGLSTAMDKANVDELAGIGKSMAAKTREISSITAASAIRIKRIRDIEAAIKGQTATVVADANMQLRKLRELEIAEHKRLRAIERSARQQAADAEVASQKTQAVGSAMTMTGLAALGIGAAAVLGFNRAADAASEYAQQVSRSFTQVDNSITKVDITMKNVADLGKKIATEFALPFEQTQEAIYDMFSSIDVTSKEMGESLMKAVSEAAVGGVTTTEVATDALITAMNGYGLKIEDITMINDVLFQTVAKGIGTFEEMSNAMGIATASAKNANQPIKQTATMIAFMTKMGMKVEKVGTYAARAFDMISNPRFEKNVKKFGISIRNAKGELLPMNEIVAKLKTKLDGMSPKEASKALAEIKKGAGGTIQAMKFFNAALNDTDGNYQKLVGTIEDSSKVLDENGNVVGAAQRAYELMAKTDANRLVVASNKISIAITEIGDAILPVKVAVTEFFAKFAEAFSNLSPEMRKIIGIVGAVVAGFLILSGIALILVGSILMLSAAAATAGVLISTIVWPVLAVMAAVAALIAIGHLLITNWDAISAFFKPMVDGIVAGWNRIGELASEAWKKFQPVMDLFGNTFKNIWEEFVQVIDSGVSWIMTVWNSMAPAMENLGKGFGDIGAKLEPFIGGLINLGGVIASVIGGIAVGAFTLLMGTIGFVWKIISGFIAGILPGLMMLWTGLVGIVGGIMDLLTGLFTLDPNKFFAGLTQIVVGTFAAIVGIIAGAGGAIFGAVAGLVDGVIQFFIYMWDVLVGHSIVPDMINAIITWFASLPGQVISFVIGLVTGVISWFGSLASRAIAAAVRLVTGVVAFLRGLPSKAISAVSALAGMLASKGAEWFTRLGTAVNTGISKVVGFAKSIPGKIIGALGSAGSMLSNAGSSIMGGFLSGLRSGWNAVTGFVGGIAGWIQRNKGPISYDLKLLNPAGNAIMKGLHKGLRGSFGLIKRDIEDVNSMMSLSSPGTQQFGSVYRPTDAANKKGGKVTVNIHTQELDPIKHGADVGFQIARNSF